MIRLGPEELRLWTDQIYALCGVHLDSSKGYLIESRLGELLSIEGCGSFGELLHRVRNDSSRGLQRRVVDAITTGETLFFRDAAPFELLQHKLIPELIDRRTRQLGVRARVPIRIWSAACSTGQEVYSVAMVLSELLAPLERYEIRILGTDISDRALAYASRGHFNKIEVERGLPPEKRDRFFQKEPGSWRVRDELRALASFRRVNLLRDLPDLGRFDVIMCRNVAIYFREEDRVLLFERLAEMLDPEGALIIGATECIAGSTALFEAKRHLRAVFYQKRNRGC